MNIKPASIRGRVNVHKEYPIRTSEGVNVEFADRDYREFTGVVHLDLDGDAELDTSWLRGGGGAFAGTSHYIKTDEPIFKTSFADLKELAESKGQDFIEERDVRSVKMSGQYSSFQYGGIFSNSGRLGGPFWMEAEPSLTNLLKEVDLVPPESKWAIDFTSNSLLLYTDKKETD